MFRVMVVDDEIWILRGMRKLVPWEEHGFEVERTFTDPYEALESFGESPADVVFADISMPGMDGLSLIRNMKAIRADTQFVILTAYSEFEYAKEAISLQVMDYLVKPITEDMLIATLRKLREALKRREMFSERAQVYARLTQPGGELTGYELQQLTQVEWTQGMEAAVYAQYGGDDALAHADSSSCLFESKEDNFYFRIYAGTPEALRNRLVAMEKRAKDVGRIVGYSGEFADLRGFRAALRRARLSARHDFFDERCGVFQFREEAALPRTAELVLGLIHEQEWKSAACAMQDLPAAADESWRISDALRLYQRAAEALNASGFSLQPLDSEEILLTTYRGFEDLCRELRSIMLELVSSGSVEILKVESYIQHHFNMPELCVQYIADALGIDPGYLGRKYRREMNKGIGQSIQEKRMQYACKLLKETKITVREIARLCGYTDPFYFNKVFKKTYKATPVQYRKMQKVQ